MRTGLGGQNVVMNGGALVLPIVHEIIPVNMNTLRLEVKRGRESALITHDRMRVDVVAEFYVRVQPSVEAIAIAAQTLGQRTMQPEALRELVEGKFVDALRSVAAEMTMEELHEQRGEYVRLVSEAAAEDLFKNGLELETVSLTGLDQTSMEFFNPSNAFDAEGLTRLTEEIERRKKLRNDIEQDTMIQIRNKNLEAEQLGLDDRPRERVRAPAAGARDREAPRRAAVRARPRARPARAGSRAGADRGARAPSRRRASSPSARSTRSASRARSRPRRWRSSGARRSSWPSRTARSPSPRSPGPVRGAGGGRRGARRGRLGRGEGVLRARDRDGRAAQEHRADRRARRRPSARRSACGSRPRSRRRSPPTAPRRSACRPRARPRPTRSARSRRGCATRSRPKARA